MATEGMSRLPRGVYAICDPEVRPELSLAAKATLFLLGGAAAIQFRAKRLDLRQFVELSRQITALCRAAGTPCLINDRVDVALLVDADGVHLGDDDLPVKQARQLLGPSRIVGATVRNAEQARRARADGADYVGLGPIFATSTKRLQFPPLGIARFREIAADIELPVVGIGGITAQNISDVAAAGAIAAASISALLDGDLTETTGSLVRAFNAGRRRNTLEPR